MTKPTTRFAHTEGKTVLCYSPDGRHIITGGADNFVRVFDAGNLASEPRQIDHHTDAVTAVAISPQGDRIVTGCVDNLAALFGFPECEFEGYATRSQTPLCDVTFSPSGAFVAVACEDGTIRHVTHATNQVVMLKGHSDAVLHLAYDPLGRYLASSSADGSVRIWQTDDGTCVHELKHGYGHLEPGSDATSAPAWHPDGTLLAVPGVKGVRLLERDKWSTHSTLSGQGSSAEQRLCAFSTSGQYIAVCGLDKQLFVWDLQSSSGSKGETLSKFVCDEMVSALAWSPVGNALAFATTDGSMSLWEGVVPEHLNHPAIATHAVDKATAKAAADAADDDDALEAAIAAELGELDDEADRPAAPPPRADAAPAGGGAPPQRRRLQTGAGGGDDDDDDDMNGLETREAKEAARLELELAIAREERLKALRDGQRAAAAPPPPPAEKNVAQGAIQPGATPWHKGRRFLAYNLLGSITSRDVDGGECIVEVTFADAENGRSMPGKHDPHRSSMAALDESGAVFAAESQDGRPSIVWYWAFKSWAGNSDWLAQLPPGEEAVAVTHGYRFVAVATSARTVRVFSDTGRPLAMWTARSAIVALAAFDSTFSVITHDARGALPDEQALMVSVYSLSDPRRLRRLRERPVPLSPGATLVWVSHSREGVLTTVDSAGIVRSAVSAWDYEWMPVLDSSTSRKNKSERQWAIGVDETQFLCVHCKGSGSGGLDFPPVLPAPVVSSIPLSLPVARVDGVSPEMDASALLLAAQLEEKRGLLRSVPSEEAASDLAEHVVAHIKAIDMNTLKLIGAACATNRAARALDLASQLRMPRMLEGSIKLAQHHKQIQLAERIALLMRVTFGSSAISDEDLLFDLPLEQGPYAHQHQHERSGLGGGFGGDGCYAAGGAVPPAPSRAHSALRASEPFAPARASDSLGERRRLAAERASARAGGGSSGGIGEEEEGGVHDGADEAGVGAEPDWVDKQHASRTAAAASREAMRPLQALAGPGGGGGAGRNPFAKPQAAPRAATMATPGSNKDVLNKLQSLSAQPMPSADDPFGAKRKAAGQLGGKRAKAA